MRGIKFVCVLILSLISNIAIAHNKVVVIPLGADELNGLANIVTVSTADGDFTDPIDALSSITDASASNPYVVLIGPGRYSLGIRQLVMKPHVNIVGSGKAVTVLASSIGTSNSTNFNNDGEGMAVYGAADSSISQLTITQFSLTNFAGGIFNDSAAVSEINNVSVQVSSDSGVRVGIANYQSPAGRISDVDVHMVGSMSSNTGIISQGSMILSNAHVTVNGHSSSIGVLMSADSSQTLRIQSSTIIGDAPSSVLVSGGARLYASNTEVENVLTSGNCSFVFSSTGAQTNANCSFPP